MEVEEIQTPACKLPRIDNGRTKLAQKDHYPDEEDEHRDSSQHHNIKRPSSSASASAAAPLPSADGFRGWHHSSRIIRVSRASGGKDRHSKVLTSKGLRDRRVRLSVTTAIQFYDLQDRLGYDQPSKAVEWLIKAAADSIAELPSLNNSPFPDTPKQLSDEKRASEEHGGGFDSVELDGNEGAAASYQSQKLSKSACSSNSETSKGSGLSLSRSEQRNNRVKARERARVRAKEKEKEIDSSSQHHHNHNVNHISQSSSFTELLTGGIGTTTTTTVNNNATSPNGGGGGSSPPNNGLFQQKTGRSWSTTTTPMDYFNIGLLGPSSSTSSSRGQHHHHHFNSLAQTMPISIPSPFGGSNENHHHHHQQQEMQHFPFVPDHMIPVTSTQQQGGLGGDDDNNNNLNFTISSGFNRGTLQSNSSSTPPPYLQRFTHSPIDGPNLPFYIPPPPPPVDHHHHHHQFPAGFDPRLHLYYGDGSRNSDHKGKPKN